MADRPRRKVSCARAPIFPLVSGRSGVRARTGGAGRWRCVRGRRHRRPDAVARRTGLASGTLYPILARLSDAELLETRWEDGPAAGRPPRHLYRLTAAGAEIAAESAEFTREAVRRPLGRPALGEA
ncbi:PadR family transcriptional regulator [Nocardia sp. NPDC004711]